MSITEQCGHVTDVIIGDLEEAIKLIAQKDQTEQSYHLALERINNAARLMESSEAYLVPPVTDEEMDEIRGAKQ